MSNWGSNWGALTTRPTARSWGQLDESLDKVPGFGPEDFGPGGFGSDDWPDDDWVIGTTPGAVPVRVENWDIEAQPFATYTIASGDTFVGLAITYLGNGERWPEIWHTGGNQAKFPNPDVITSSGPLDMPEEARERMKLFLSKGKTGTPGDIKKSELQQAKSKTRFVVAGAVGLVALGTLGVVLYNMS